MHVQQNKLFSRQLPNLILYAVNGKAQTIINQLHASNAL